ncbi:MAG: peptide deformylase [Oscillospiraceae bacterium]|nr:peptide deformylase [Oscillospiraceae bacterium]
MIKPIIRDTFFLSRVSAPATAEDVPIARDLLDTLAANSEHCVGLAANMIGELKRILVFDNNGEAVVMINPEILKRSQPYSAEEGCLSLDGTRRAERFRSIKVRWQNMEMQTRIKTFTGFPAQIIQHEMDHFEGIII